MDARERGLVEEAIRDAEILKIFMGRNTRIGQDMALRISNRYNEVALFGMADCKEYGKLISTVCSGEKIGLSRIGAIEEFKRVAREYVSN